MAASRITKPILALLSRIAAAAVTVGRKFQTRASVDDVDALLPQWQCGQCGFAACRPYAEAMVAGTAEINLCPPGGERGVRKLAVLLHREFKPLPVTHAVTPAKSVAVIDERMCIGCTLCIQACPVDAIIGAAQQMHTVAATLCTGCALCLPPCPVACIRMAVVPPTRGWIRDYFIAHRVEAHARQAARTRFRLRNLRLSRAQSEKLQQRSTQAGTIAARDKKQRQALVAAAMERARAQQQVVRRINIHPNDDKDLTLMSNPRQSESDTRNEP